MSPTNVESYSAHRDLGLVPLLAAPQDNLLLLAFAGHDTTATAISLALKMLSQHPAVLAKLRAEQQAAVAQHGSAITDAVLRECTYLDATVKELLRHQVGAWGCWQRLCGNVLIYIPNGSGLD
jgi:cytochrome P450